MGKGVGLRQVGYFDCAGGGQVVVDGTVAYVAHMESPEGTTIVDVSDPSNPKQLAQVQVPPGTHSHKVRVGNGIMIVNNEFYPRGKTKPEPDFQGGYTVYDVSTPSKPRQLYRSKENGKGVHRFDFDGRYAFMSPTVDGYIGNIVMIVDFKNPERPEEVGRWWEPGQWIAGGEKPTWENDFHRCHHPLRLGNRLYVSYWLGGMFILDIDDMSKPKMVSHMRWRPPYACPVHTALPLPYEIDGRKLLMVAEEDVWRTPDERPGGLWMVDITNDKYPFVIGSFQMPELERPSVPPFTACHQPSERINGTEIPVAYFAHGVRVVDVSKPRALREVAHYVPDLPAGAPKVQANDVTFDDRGLIYLIDRYRGLTILERTK